MNATGRLAPRGIAGALLLLEAATACAAMRFDWRRVGPGEEAEGAAVSPGLMVSWGTRLSLRSLPSSAPRPIGSAARAAAFSDLNGDGRLDIVACESDPPALAWYAAPHWTRAVIDRGADCLDLLPARLLGRSGVLLIHRRTQLRFYAAPDWAATDLYSIYTPSLQGGLALDDIDRDGRPDILCGNYWLRSPASFGLPWPLFAINVWTEEERSALLRLAPLPGGLAAAQRGLADGRIAVFARPDDPRLLWRARLLGRFDRPDFLLAADFDGDGRTDLLAAERGPSARVMAFRAPDYRPQVLRAGAKVSALHPLPAAGGSPEVVLLSPAALEYGRCRPAPKAPDGR